MTGVVSRLFLTRGFGFIAGDDGEDYFLHVDELHAEQTWEALRTGKAVEFEPMKNGLKQNRLRAVKVKQL